MTPTSSGCFPTIIVCGPPAAGKTLYGTRIATECGATLLDIDLATERLVRLGLRESGRNPDDRDSDYFKATYRQEIYETLFDLARENSQWHPVVIVGPFTREIRNPRWPEELAERLGCSIEVHFVYCPPDVRRRRMEARGAARDKPKLADWAGYIRYYDERPPAFDHRLVDSTV